MISATFWLLAAAPAVDVAAESPWPQWRGPHRDGISAEKNLLKDWPEGGPPLAWKFSEAGFGYGEVAVVGDDLYLLGKFDGEGECLVRLDAKTGKAAGNRAKIDDAPNKYLTQWGGGPRSTPTVEGPLAWALSSDGTLACFDRQTLAPKWSVDLKARFGSKPPTWGYAESPLVDGDLVVVTPGGGKCVAALDKKTGETVWTSEGVNQGHQYSSLVPCEIAGTRMFVTQGAKSLFAVDAKTGKMLWQSAGKGRATAVIPTPIVSGDRIYSTAGYGFGCECVDIKKEGDGFVAVPAYANKNMVNHHGGAVLLNDHVFGHSDNGGWTCQKLATGEVAWKHRERNAGKGSIGYADGRCYCLEEKVGGECILIEASTEGWKEHGRFKLPANSELNRGQGQIWTHPVVAGGKLYLRDLDLLYCFDIATK